MGRGQKGNLTLKSLLPAASPQGSPAMWEPDILRLKANVSGGPELCQGVHSASWGQGQHRRADPSGPSVPWVAVPDSREHGAQEEEDPWGLQPDGPSPRSPSPGKAVRSLELTLGLTQNQVYNQLTTPHPHPGHHIQGLVWSH